MPGALLSINGRVISDFTLVHPGEQLWTLLPPPNQVQRLMQEFQPPAALYRNLTLKLLEGQRCTRFEPANTEKANPWACTLGDGCYSVELPVADDALVTEWVYELPTEADPAPASEKDWMIHRLRSGNFPVSNEIADKFTAHALHLHTNGVVDFDKGCYRGQEIVVRTEHRGKVKRALRLLHTNQAVPVGTSVEQQQKPVGDIVLCYSLPEGDALLVAHLPVEAQDDLTATGLKLTSVI